jgi:nitronate monooxygenase
LHKESLLSCGEDDTLVTEKFSGGPARALANRFIREMEAAGAPQLAFPAQNALTGPLRAAAGKAGNREFLSMYAGQAAPLSRALPAGELVARLHAEALEALDRLLRLRR